MLVRKAQDRAWDPTPHPGIERALFRANDRGGRASVVRLAAGARVPRHRHEGTEEVLVLAGAVSIGGVELAAGDYLYTEPGEEHDVVAMSAAMLFVSSQRATPLVNAPPPDFNLNAPDV
jgi:quercetin dioxygenase-like cupin family protein